SLPLPPCLAQGRGVHGCSQVKPLLGLLIADGFRHPLGIIHGKAYQRVSLTLGKLVVPVWHGISILDRSPPSKGGVFSVCVGCLGFLFGFAKLSGPLGDGSPLCPRGF